MKVLVACEFSQAVAGEFLKRGHDAWSCDILPCEGEYPERHFQCDVLPIMYGHNWDLVIAHPPCTYLTATGNRWFDTGKYGQSAWERMNKRNDAIKFFYQFVLYQAKSRCKMAIENPVGVMSTAFRRPNQIINPYQFGGTERKKTCLWLFNLPVLEPTEINEPEGMTDYGMGDWYYETSKLSKEQRAHERSKTFPGIAKAMAEQWGKEESLWTDDE